MEDIDNELEPVESIDDEPLKEDKPAALTLVIQSWATPIIGLIMLVSGLIGGYYIRPILSPEPVPVVAAEVSTSSESETVPAVVPTSDADRAAQQQELMGAVVERTRHFRGDPDAPVTIIEFSDFLWPYCERFAAGAGRQIDEQYIQQGLVRIGYWHFAFLGQESQWSAEASECAADQDAFWEYHDYLFENLAGGNRGAISQENLKRFADELGLDTEAFNDCLDSGRHSQIVQSETTSGRQLGIQSTPTFLVNGQPVVGAQPFEVFEQVIEQELNQ